MKLNTNANIIVFMANLKLKYTLEEANEKLISLQPQFPPEARLKYCLESGVPHSTLYRYLNGKVPSPVAANHLLEYVETYIKNNPIAA